MTRVDLSPTGNYKARFAEFTSLLDPLNSVFEETGSQYGWKVIRDSNRQPSCDLRKLSESGRTTFFMGVLLDQVWYHIDLEADLAADLTYTFKVSAITKTFPGKSQSHISQQLDLMQHQSLEVIMKNLDSLIAEALRIVDNFDEP